jgi:hypothetical protein
VKIRIRQVVKWCLVALAVVVALFALYLSVFFLPYPLFPHHMEHAGFSVYSDGDIPGNFDLVLEDARLRLERMELYRGAAPPRIFMCQSQRLFVFLVKLAGKRHVGQGLLISVAGNAFFSKKMIETVGRRNKSLPLHSRMHGSWAAAISHEAAHQLVFSEVGLKVARRMPVWKSEGYADYSANFAATAADPDYDLRNRIGFLLDDDSWQTTMGFVDRRHFRWHLLVEFLCSVKGLAFEDLMDGSVTEESAEAEMMSWYSSHDS